MSASSLVQELEPVLVEQEGGAALTLRCFSLTYQNVTVELCSVGASITKILLPRGGDGEADDSQQQQPQHRDDIVLGYQSPTSLLKNPPYFAAIVGRVANRIALGEFDLNDQHYELAINNGPNHLHGGLQGFSHKNWNAAILPNNDGVQFSLISADGDEGYPGAIKVLATYSLRPARDNSSSTLRLEMEAHFLDSNQTLSTPINLAQHSYFNLAGHDHQYGVLDHSLWMPNSPSYTPKDAVTSIPTRQIKLLEEDLAMDWRTQRSIRDGLVALAVQHEGLGEDEARAHIDERLSTPVFVAKSALLSGEPYGFDHNYIVEQKQANDGDDSSNGLRLVAILEHAASQRRLTVRSNAPGVQLYTANYLDGKLSLDPACRCKGEDASAAVYGQWQGICLETQHYPDSILSAAEEEQFAEFAKGKCFVLTPGGEKYQHTVEYEFGSIV